MPTLSLAHLTLLQVRPPVVGDPPLRREIKQRLSQSGISILDVEAFWLMPDTSIDNLMPFF